MHNSDFKIKHTFKIRSRCVGDVCVGAFISGFAVLAGSLLAAALRSMQSSLKLIDRSEAPPPPPWASPPPPPPSPWIIWPSPTLEGFGLDGGRILGVGRGWSGRWSIKAECLPCENTHVRSRPPPGESMAPSLPIASRKSEGGCDAPVWPYAHRKHVHIMHSMYVFYNVYVF